MGLSEDSLFLETKEESAKSGAQLVPIRMTCQKVIPKTRDDGAFIKNLMLLHVDEFLNVFHHP